MQLASRHRAPRAVRRRLAVGRARRACARDRVRRRRLPRGVSGVVSIPRNAFRREPSSESDPRRACRPLSTTPKDGETVLNATPSVGAMRGRAASRRRMSPSSSHDGRTQVSQLTPTSISYAALVPFRRPARRAFRWRGRSRRGPFTIPADVRARRSPSSLRPPQAPASRRRDAAAARAGRRSWAPPPAGGPHRMGPDGSARSRSCAKVSPMIRDGSRSPARWISRPRAAL
jgi:hypothetical protein